MEEKEEGEQEEEEDCLSPTHVILPLVGLVVDFFFFRVSTAAPLLCCIIITQLCAEFHLVGRGKEEK